MKRRSFSNAPCSIARSLDLLGDWWVPLIIRECLYGVHRFDGFQERLDIARNILTDRLELLTQEGVLEKKVYQNTPERFEYHLTNKGYDAARVLLALMAFGETWCFNAGQEPILLYDTETDARVKPLMVDSKTKRPINVRNLYPGPGPGFPHLNQDILEERFVEYSKRQQKKSNAKSKRAN